jgi:hypothetical protein
MTDAAIVDLYNGILESQHCLLAEWDETSSKNRWGKSKSTITKTASMGPAPGLAPLHHRRRRL